MPRHPFLRSDPNGDDDPNGDEWRMTRMANVFLDPNGFLSISAEFFGGTGIADLVLKAVELLSLRWCDNGRNLPINVYRVYRCIGPCDRRCKAAGYLERIIDTGGGPGDDEIFSLDTCA